MATAGALRELYRDLTELDRRPEGTRYAAALRDGTPVVVLTLDRELAAGIQYTEPFLATLARAAAVQHEALARPVSWGRARSGLLHCAYHRLDVQPVTLGSQSAMDVAAIGLQLSHALVAAHGAGLTHGAINPERIARSERHGARLNMFGLCAALCAGGVGVREASLAVGDLPYVSPEQQAGTAPDERSDIYALGASLYALLTGKPPFGGRTTSFVMATVLSDRDAQDSASAANRGSRVVVDALLRAIERAPEDRWPSAAAFAQALAAGVTARGTGVAEIPSVRGWSKFVAIFRDALFPTRRSRE